MGFSPWKIAFGIPAGLIATGVGEIILGGYINDGYKTAQRALNSTGLPLPATEPFNTAPGWAFFILGILIFFGVLYAYSKRK